MQNQKVQVVKELNNSYVQVIATILGHKGILGGFTSKPLLGPRSITYYLQLQNPSQLSEVIKMPEELALALRSKSVIIFRRGGLIIMQVSVPERFWQPVIRGIDTTGLEIGVGETFKQKVEFDFEIPHTLVAGTTGAGKSHTTKNIILGLIESYTPDELEMVYIDPNSDFVEFANEVHTVRFPFGSNAVMQEQWDVVAVWLRKLVDNRRENNLRDAKRIVIVVDEAEFVRDTSTKTYEELVVIANQGRKYNINLILTAKKPTQSNLPNITHLAGNRFVGRLEVDKSTSTKMVGQSGVDLRLLGLKGDFLHIAGDGVSRSTIAELPSGFEKGLSYAEKPVAQVEDVPLVDNQAKAGRPCLQLDMKTLAYYFINDPRKVTLEQAKHLGLTRGQHELHRDKCLEFGKWVWRFKKGLSYAKE